MPAGKAVSVTIQDPEQKPVYQKTLTASANGTIHDDLTLAGQRRARATTTSRSKSGEGFMNGNFEVEEYKKPEYEVRVMPGKARVLQGETVQAAIDARYYFGEPVNGAKVTLRRLPRPLLVPALVRSRRSNRRSVAGGDDTDDTGDQVAEGEGQLDADGKLTINVADRGLRAQADYLYRIEARVTDQANREITGRGWVVATYGSFVVNAAPERYFYAPGSTAAFDRGGARLR